jgi:hypothetical protein
MDAKTSLNEKPASRNVTEGPERAPHGFFDFDIESVRFTPDFADLKPAGRYVAKDLLHVGDASSPMMMTFSAYICGGEIIDTDGDLGRFDGCINESELDWRGTVWKLSAAASVLRGLSNYAQQVGSACRNAVTHSGGSAGKACYADL